MMGKLADIFTAARLGIAAFIVYAGVQFGREAFGAVAFSTLGGWTLDTLDGHLARADADRKPSWWGENERLIDTVMILAGFIYLTMIGVVPVWVSVGYLILGTLVFLRFRSAAVLTLVEGPLALLVPLVAFFVEPLWGWLYVAWGVVALVLDRHRLAVRLRILWRDALRLLGREDPGAPQEAPSGPTEEDLRSRA
jgi:hypothetical protein